MIRVLCTGRVDPALVADAFLNGADGILVIGCHFGECHYVSGNVMAKDKLDMTREILTYAGLHPDRLQFSNLSSAEAARFAKCCTEFVEAIKRIGPLGNGDGVELTKLKDRLEAARRALADKKLRWVIGKKPVLMREGNKYGEVFTEHEMNRSIGGIIIDEMATHAICAALEKRDASVKDLSKTLDIPAPDVLKYVLALKRRGLVKIETVAGQSPVYRRNHKKERCLSGRQ
jgi:coenzyme F420-reducing hydrogenase delta subunit